MTQNAIIEIEMPLSIEQFRLPTAVNDRLQKLLDRQDEGGKLSTAEKEKKPKDWLIWRKCFRF